MRHISLCFGLLGYLLIFAEGSLTGKIMCGYQAWFTADGDGSGNGWTHYKMHSSQPFAKNNCVFDFWPDVKDYPISYKIP